MSSKAMCCIGTLNDGTQLWISYTSLLPRRAHRPRTNSDFDDVRTGKNQLLDHFTSNDVPCLRAHINNRPVQWEFNHEDICNYNSTRSCQHTQKCTSFVIKKTQANKQMIWEIKTKGIKIRYTLAKFWEKKMWFFFSETQCINTFNLAPTKNCWWLLQHGRCISCYSIIAVHCWNRYTTIIAVKLEFLYNWS